MSPVRSLVVLVLLFAACGKVSDDGEPIDADVSSTDCEIYCECMTGTCGEDDAFACVNECLDLDQEPRDCRVIHCGLAQSAEEAGNQDDVELHCGHANGIGLCQAAD